MGNEAAIAEAIGDRNVKGRDLRQYYSAWGKRALPDEAILALSYAHSTMPENHIGFDAWITMIAWPAPAAWRVREWALSLGRTVAAMKPRIKTRSRTYCEAYADPWGGQAALDGAAIALFGHWEVPGLNARSAEFGVSAHTYNKIRSFVQGAVEWQAGQFEASLTETVRLKLHGRKFDLL